MCGELLTNYRFIFSQVVCPSYINASNSDMLLMTMSSRNHGQILITVEGEAIEGLLEDVTPTYILHLKKSKVINHKPFKEDIRKLGFLVWQCFSRYFPITSPYKIQAKKAVRGRF